MPYAKGKAPKGKKKKKKKQPQGVVLKPPKKLKIVAAPGEVKLIKAGSEPLQKLRLNAKVGHKEKVQMTMAMNIGMELDGKKAPSGALPPMLMTMDLAVVENRDGGDMKYDFVLSHTDIPPVKGIQPQVVQMMKKGLKKLRQTEAKK